jgi:hypothetical protein
VILVLGYELFLAWVRVPELKLTPAPISKPPSKSKQGPQD